jgi:hypothetical protein
MRRNGTSAPVWITLLALAACGRTADFSGPAPAGAMQCALEHAIVAGYVSVEGGVDRGFLRLAQAIPEASQRDRPEPDPDLGDVVLRAPRQIPVENQLEIREEREMLRISVIGLPDEGVRVGPGGNAEDHARTILAHCTATPPLPPESVDEQTPPGVGQPAPDSPR